METKLKGTFYGVSVGPGAPELLTYQANLAGLFGIENARSAPKREHQQEEK